MFIPATKEIFVLFSQQKTSVVKGKTAALVCPSWGSK